MFSPLRIHTPHLYIPAARYTPRSARYAPRFQHQGLQTRLFRIQSMRFYWVRNCNRGLLHIGSNDFLYIFTPPRGQ